MKSSYCGISLDNGKFICQNGVCPQGKYKNHLLNIKTERIMAKFAPQLLSEECFGTGDYPCDDTYSQKTGKIIVPVSGRDTSYFLLSDDNGKTFRKEERKDSRHEKYRELSDGTFLALGV